jgi:acyl-CoA thioesterase I
MVRWGAALKVSLLIIVAPAAPEPAAAAEPCRIAVLGDSLTSGYGLDLEEAFPARLAAALDRAGLECEVVDAGVTGDTSAGARARLDWLLADRPSHVIIELGGNDALRALPPEQMAENLDAILARLDEAGIEALLAGMYAPPNLGPEYVEAFAAVFPRLAREHGVPLYPFFLEGVAGDPALNQPDGIHPSAEGVEVIVRRMLPLMIAWLADRPAGGRPTGRES